MQPPKSRRRLRPVLISSLIVFSMILETPRPLPQLLIIGGQHTAFPASGHNFVLAKGEGGNIAETSNRSPLISCPMRLSTIFDDFEPMFMSQLDDWIHIAGPTRQVNHNDRFSVWG